MHPSRLSPATVVSVPASVLGGLHTVDHFGLVSDRRDQHGFPYVYNSSKRTGKVMLEPWHAFTQGQEHTVHELRGHYSPREVLKRARSRPDHQWDVLSANCEHYVRWAHGLEVKSPQVRQTGAVVGLAALVLALVGGAAAASRD